MKIIKTRFNLIVNDEIAAQDGDKVKVTIDTGEILIGTYESSDYTSLTLDRQCCGIDIDFSEIENIEVLK